MRLIQVTLLAGATRITAAKLYTPSLMIQNNAAAVVRVGDNTVSATKGIALAAGSTTTQPALVIKRADNRVPVFDYYLFGTTGQIIDVMYE